MSDRLPPGFVCDPCALTDSDLDAAAGGLPAVQTGGIIIDFRSPALGGPDTKSLGGPDTRLLANRFA